MHETTALPLDEVGPHLASRELDDGVPRVAVVVIDLDTGCSEDGSAVEAAVRDVDVIAIGVTCSAPGSRTRGIREALACTLTSEPTRDRTCISVPDVPAAVGRIRESVARSPIAALAMRRLVEATSRLPVREGLGVESAVYSMLLAGSEFAAWRAGHEIRHVAETDAAAVVLERVGDELRVQLTVPQRRNAYSCRVRDGLVEGLDLALADDSIRRVLLTGTGPAFCSGGDLDEFGLSSDVSVGHLVRLAQSAALRAYALRERLEVHLHGPCIGAGIEIPSFAGRVIARNDTTISLPELGMGLVPGAGGTVGITRRIGRWRCAWLHLSGERIGIDAALNWGLVDERG